MTKSHLRCFFAEVVGTFALVFAGTGAIIINDVSGGAVTHLGISLTFGLIVMAMIYAVGDVSGAHLNPAVTIGFWLAKRLPFRALPRYLAAQVVGGVAASALLRVLFIEHATLGATLPQGTLLQCFVFEVILTLILMFVILCVATGSREQGLMAGIAIGGTVALEAAFAGPLTGASMNPIRSLAPALLSLQLADVWLYLLAPTVGAMLAVVVWRGVTVTKCEPASL